MDRHQQLLQRYRDGRLGRDESAAVEALVAGRADLAAQAEALARLDAGLRAEAAPRRARDADALQAAILARLPAAPPRAEARIRLLDGVYAAMAAGVVVMTYAVIGTVTDQVRLLFALALVSLVAGCVVLLMAGSLRRVEADVLGRLLRRHITIGPGDVLVTRAVGLAVAIGGVWLARTLA